MIEVDRVVEMLDAGMSPPLPDLERAVAVLRGSAGARSLEECVTFVRIAVELERVERVAGVAPAVA